jgi:hypothetical protein
LAYVRLRIILLDLRTTNKPHHHASSAGTTILVRCMTSFSSVLPPQASPPHRGVASKIDTPSRSPGRASPSSAASSHCLCELHDRSVCLTDLTTASGDHSFDPFAPQAASPCRPLARATFSAPPHRRLTGNRLATATPSTMGCLPCFQPWAASP